MRSSSLVKKLNSKSEKIPKPLHVHSGIILVPAFGLFTKLLAEFPYAVLFAVQTGLAVK